MSLWGFFTVCKYWPRVLVINGLTGAVFEPTEDITHSEDRRTGAKTGRPRSHKRRLSVQQWPLQIVTYVASLKCPLMTLLGPAPYVIQCLNAKHCK